MKNTNINSKENSKHNALLQRNLNKITELPLPDLDQKIKSSEAYLLFHLLEVKVKQGARRLCYETKTRQLVFIFLYALLNNENIKKLKWS